MQEFTIGEIARRAGIQSSAIRYYERVGLLPPPKRVNGRRCYDASVLQRLRLIQLTRRVGFRISELQALFTESSPDIPPATRWQTVAAEKVAEMEALIERTQASKMWLMEAQRCQCMQGGECIVDTPDDTGNASLLF